MQIKTTKQIVKGIKETCEKFGITIQQLDNKITKSKDKKWVSVDDILKFFKKNEEFCDTATIQELKEKLES